MNQPGRRRALGLSFDNRVVLCAVVLVALIWSATALVARRDRQQAIDAAIHSNSQLARAFEQHTASAMAQVQQLAVLMRTQYHREGAVFDLPHWFEAIRVDRRFVQNVLITDANGRVVASSAGRGADVNLADREHFSVHVARDTGMLYISRPILTRVTSEWAILASLRINQPDGSFGGTAVVRIDPSYFSDFYKEIDLGEQGAVNLIGLDGFVRARSKGNLQNAGQDIRGGELFRQLQNAPQGSFFATALVDGVRRIQSYRKLAGYPLVVAVGTAEETALAEYSKHRDMYVLGAMLMTLLIVFAARWIRRSAVRQRNGAAVLLESENRLRQLTQSLELQVEERTAQAHAREQLLRLVTENLPVLIGYFDVDQRIKFVNSRFAAVLGAADGEPLTGKPISELIPADLMAFHRPYIAAVLAGKPQRYEAVALSGRSKTFEMSLIPEFDGNGKVAGVFALSVDISERIKAERQLRAAVSQLSATLDATADGILVVGLKRDRVRFNRRYAEMTGLAPESSGVLMLRDVLERFAQQVIDRDAFMSRVHEIYAQPLEASADVLEFKDGRVFERYSFPEMLDGQPVGRVFSFRDVTERRRADAALRAADSRYRTMVANMHEGVTVRDANGVVVDCNASAERILGRTRAEICGNLTMTGNWKVIDINGQIVPQEQRSAMLALSTGKAHSDVVLGVHSPGGKVLWLSSTSQPMFDSGHEKPTGVFTTFVDITERKLAEDARDAFEAQLRESQKMEAMGTLAGGIAHDFNNLLAAILGNAALASEELGAAHPVAPSVAEIDKAGRRAKHLVQQILAFSRKQTQDFTDRHLQREIEETLGLLRATLPAGVEIETRLSAQAQYVRADATQIGQVLMNLCTNAWHAMAPPGGDGPPRGRIVIGLDTIALDEPGALRYGVAAAGKYVRLSVADTGAGMDAPTLARIFDPFFTTKPVGEGTGLGLSVVHGIVKSHSGGVMVTSAPGAGTTVEVVLPAIAEPLQAPVAADAAKTTQPVAGRHVLYLDDEEAMVFLVKRMLEKRGYRVSGFEQPDEALAAVREAPGEFHVVVTDYNMPGKSGLDVAREVREINPDLPLVITSGYISAELRSSAGLLGVRHVIYKPNTVEDLCQAIAQVLEAPPDSIS